MNSPALLKNSPPPRFATPRPIGKPTYGPAIAKLMTMGGTPPMPWQQWAADIIGEIDPATGLRRWPTVVISVPRQSGKTRMIGSVALHRALQAPKSRVWYTAQTGQHARRNWMEFTDDIVNPRFPLAPLMRRMKSRGDEQLIIPKLGSTFCPHPPSADSLHGVQSDMNIIDEGWVFDEDEGAALLQAVVPTQATRPGAQTILISTRGTSASTWFHDFVDRARAGADGIALLDWGIPDDADPTDLDAIAACHPAVGFTQSRESLEAAFTQLGHAPGEFARAYGNRVTGSAERLIPLEAWEMAQTRETIPDNAAVAIGAAVAFDRSHTAIVAAAIVHRRPMIEVVDLRPGTRWAADRILAIADKWRAPVAIDAMGPSASLADEVRRRARGGVLYSPTARDLTAACQEFYDRLMHTSPGGEFAPTIRIRPDEALDRAVELAEKRRIGDAWIWARRGLSGSIAPLEAATLAMSRIQHARPAVAPMIV